MQISEEQVFKYERVMVVDDNDIDRLIADRIIKKFYLSRKVINMESGQDAIDYLLNPENSSELPEVIFLDINMPGMNGFEFLEEYEQLPAQIKDSGFIVMLTSSLNPDDHVKAIKNAHVQKFVNKPLTQEKIEYLRLLVV